MWKWGIDKFDGSDNCLRAVFCKGPGSTKLEKCFSLPKRNPKKFGKSLQELLDKYTSRVRTAMPQLGEDGKRILKVSNNLREELIKVLRIYHDGFPADAYFEFQEMLDELTQEVSFPSIDGDSFQEQMSCLFRIRELSDSSDYLPRDTFHVPTTKREVISSSRYSIAGYPSLYLTDSLELANREVGLPALAIASRFRMLDPHKILDFGIRPDDFDFSGQSSHKLSQEFIFSYLCWYPLLAACSFIRANSPHQQFHDEYIIPQLLMQWLRKIGDPPEHVSKRPSGISSDSQTISKTGNRIIHILLSNQTIQILICFERGVSNLNEKVSNDLLKRVESDTDEMATSSYLLSRRIRSYGLKSSLFEKVDEPNDHLLIRQDLLNPSLGAHFSGANIERKEIYLNVRTALVELDEILRTPSDSFNSQVVTGIISCLSSLSSFYRSVSKDFKIDNHKKRLRRIANTLDDCLNNLRWAQDGGPKIVGIRYFSCRDRFATSLGRNYVFPAEFSPGEKDGYSALLTKLFQWTAPRHLEDYPSPSDCQRALERDNLLDGEVAIQKDL